MAEMPKTAAQQAADAHAFLAARSYFDHRSQLQSLLAARPGMCMADGLGVQQQTIDGDFDLDEPLVRRLLQVGTTGPVMRAAPARAPRPAPPPAGPSALERYVSSPPPAGAPYSAQRLGEEVPGAVYGPSNVLANSTAALSGAMRGAAERDLATRLREGIQAILSGTTNRVRLSPTMELYNTAAARHPPRVRLRVRGLPITVVRLSVPALGGAQNQWRPNPSRNASTLPTGKMTAQQLRNAAVMAADHGQPSLLRWTQGRVGGGVLAFAPSAALDLYNATEVDLGTREFNVNGRQFLVASARSQSGNAVGFGFGALAVTAAVGVGVVGAPLVIIGLGVGVFVQLVWNWSGADDASAGYMDQALR